MVPQHVLNRVKCHSRTKSYAHPEIRLSKESPKYTGPGQVSISKSKHFHGIACFFFALFTVSRSNKQINHYSRCLFTFTA